jgi:ribosomal protein L37AE/L43A
VKGKRFSYKGYVPLRHGKLDLLVGEGVAKALGIDSGKVYVEVLARLQAPKKKKPEGRVYKGGKTLRQLLREADARLGVCPGCGKKMEEVHDVVGDSWQCRQCGYTEKMRAGPQGGIP